MTEFVIPNGDLDRVVMPRDLSGNFEPRDDNLYHLNIGAGLRETVGGEIETIPDGCVKIFDLNTLAGLPQSQGIYCIYGSIDNQRNFVQGYPAIARGGDTIQRASQWSDVSTSSNARDWNGWVIKSSTVSSSNGGVDVYIIDDGVTYHSHREQNNGDWSAWRIVDNLPSNIPTSAIYTASDGVKLDNNTFKLNLNTNQFNSVNIVNGELVVPSILPTISVRPRLVVTADGVFKQDKGYRGKVYSVINIFSMTPCYITPNGVSQSVDVKDAFTNLDVTINFTEGANYITNVRLVKNGLPRASTSTVDSNLNDDLIIPVDNIYVRNANYSSNTFRFSLGTVEHNIPYAVGVALEVDASNAPTGVQQVIRGEVSYTVTNPAGMTAVNRQKSDVVLSITKQP